MEKPRKGRPPGEIYPVKKQFRLSDRAAERLGELAAAWGVSESEVIRRLLGNGRAPRGKERLE